MPAPSSRRVVVVGGANMDLRATADGPVVAGTSNPGSVRTVPGGVGRNIAENLGRLGAEVTLVAPVGSDALGEELVAGLGRAGVDTGHLVRVSETGTYLAVLEPSGELNVAVSAMGATDSFGPDALAPLLPRVLDGTALVAAEANLRADTLALVLGAATARRIRTVVDPVSVAKAERLRDVLADIEVLTPNVAELAALTGCRPDDVADVEGVVLAARRVQAAGVAHVWVRRGPSPSVLVGVDGVHEIPVPDVAVVDVTGAGDSMTAALAHRLVAGDTVLAAARWAQALGSATAGVPETVHPDPLAAVASLGVADAVPVPVPVPEEDR